MAANVALLFLAVLPAWHGGRLPSARGTSCLLAARSSGTAPSLRGLPGDLLVKIPAPIKHVPAHFMGVLIKSPSHSALPCAAGPLPPS